MGVHFLSIALIAADPTLDLVQRPWHTGLTSRQASHSSRFLPREGRRSEGAFSLSISQVFGTMVDDPPRINRKIYRATVYCALTALPCTTRGVRG